MKPVFKLLGVICVLCILEVKPQNQFMRFLEEEEEEESSAPDTTSTQQSEAIVESEEEKQERLDKEIAELNAQTQKAFENTFDVSEDYRYEDMDQYKSGHFSDDDDERLAKYGSIMMSAPVSTNGYITPISLDY